MIQKERATSQSKRQRVWMGWCGACPKTVCNGGHLPDTSLIVPVWRRVPAIRVVTCADVVRYSSAVGRIGFQSTATMDVSAWHQFRASMTLRAARKAARSDAHSKVEWASSRDVERPTLGGWSFAAGKKNNMAAFQLGRDVSNKGGVGPPIRAALSCTRLACPSAARRASRAQHLHGLII